MGHAASAATSMQMNAVVLISGARATRAQTAATITAKAMTAITLARLAMDASVAPDCMHFALYSWAATMSTTPNPTPRAATTGTILRTSTFSTEDGPSRSASSPMEATTSQTPAARIAAYLVAVPCRKDSSSTGRSGEAISAALCSGLSFAASSLGIETSDSASCSDSALPTSSSSEHPSKSHSATSLSSSGVALPDSHLPIVWRLTPSLDATSSCVRFEARLRSEMLSLKSI